MTAAGSSQNFRARQKLGKYRIDRRLAEGGFATVYRATDTISGVPVALKIPHPDLMRKETLEAFRREVRVTARLDHPNILPIKDAGFIDDFFVIATPLAKETLADRLQRRLSTQTLLAFARQMLDAAAFAHEQNVMHCDIKPENFLIFPGNVLRLADFGIARVARHTVSGSGAGTVGFMAPEQALGKPSFRSDVFSLGLIIYRMFSGRTPEWPFDWPPPGHDRLRRNLHPDAIEVLRRALEVDHRRRYRNAAQMRSAFERVRPRALSTVAGRRRKKTTSRTTGDWRALRDREFKRQYGALLEARYACTRCGGPVSQAMRVCPWCNKPRRIHRGEVHFPARCPRCRRGVKSDWRYCPWCYGGAISDSPGPRYSDRRYTDRCSARGCGKPLMRFMRYCPWCNRRVRKNWRLPQTSGRCHRCGWSTLPEFWDNCPWCGARTKKA